MELIRTASGLVAAAALAAQGVASLVSPPGTSYTGTTAEVVADTLFSVALLALAVHVLSRRCEGVRRWAEGAAATGCALLASSAAATVVAERETWDAAFVVGFGLAALGWLAAAVSARDLVDAALLLGLVLTLALFASAGGFALAAAVLLSVRAPGPQEATLSPFPRAANDR